ncbi:MAG: hypothetical protein CMO44_17490 [Verrucomicrobiales bacterium]|nr:hypothetical protein [Verrucomicrobiales bacterium]
MYFANEEVCVYVSGEWVKGRVVSVFVNCFRVQYKTAGVLVTEDNVPASRLFPTSRIQTVINLASPSKSLSGKSQLSDVKSRNLASELEAARERVNSKDLSKPGPKTVSSGGSVKAAAQSFRASAPGQPRYAEMFLTLQQEVLQLRQKLDALSNGPMTTQQANLDVPFDWPAFDAISERSFDDPNLFD